MFSYALLIITYLLVRRASTDESRTAQTFPHVLLRALDFTSPLGLAVATILSAQSTTNG